MIAKGEENHEELQDIMKTITTKSTNKKSTTVKCYNNIEIAT